MKLYAKLASLVEVIRNSGDPAWRSHHEEHLRSLVKEHLPSGSGWDFGTRIELDASGPNKLVFFGRYHHMNQDGYSITWTTHRVVVTPDLMSGISLRITGRDRNDVKDYIHEIFVTALHADLIIEDAKKRLQGAL
jgi:hypothetical protein